MSRSGYDCDGNYENWAAICWHGAVTSAIRGRRGQAFLREMLDALDAMPEKRLAAREFVTSEGAVCALETVAQARGITLSDIDPEDPDACYPAAARLGIAPAMAAKIMCENDEFMYLYEEIQGPPTRWELPPLTRRRKVSPEERHRWVREWIAGLVK